MTTLVAASWVVLFNVRKAPCRFSVVKLEDIYEGELEDDKFVTIAK
ncbi:MAG: hypothetical protein ACUZ8E_06405 [Candidatus Anammoxibacter sp.]